MCTGNVGSTLAHSLTLTYCYRLHTHTPRGRARQGERQTAGEENTGRDCLPHSSVQSRRCSSFEFRFGTLRRLPTLYLQPLLFYYRIIIPTPSLCFPILLYTFSFFFIFSPSIFPSISILILSQLLTIDYNTEWQV